MVSKRHAKTAGASVGVTYGGSSHMKTRTLFLGAVASIALASTANAGHFKGWYIGAEAGANWIEDADADVVVDLGTEIGPISGATEFEFDAGWAVFATMGYAFDSNWRVEGELGYRSNETTSGTAEVNEWSVMLNALYDLELSPSMTLSLGAGAGYDHAELNLPGGFEDSDGNFAYQGIAGLNYGLSKRLDLTLTYRYLIVTDPEFDLSVPPVSIGFDIDSVRKHSLTVGLRYDLAPDEEPIAAPPPPPPPPPPPAVKSFIVFFGFAKCNITSEADAVLSEAASAAKSQGSASVKIVGHTDTVGSPKYNQRLSECRANAAKTSLVSKGIPDGAISTTGKGETELLVQTGDSVKEPQNRRATVDLQ